MNFEVSKSSNHILNNTTFIYTKTQEHKTTLRANRENIQLGYKLFKNIN